MFHQQTALQRRMKDIQEENQTLRSKVASLEVSNMSVSEEPKRIGWFFKCCLISNSEQT